MYEIPNHDAGLFLLAAFIAAAIAVALYLDGRATRRERERLRTYREHEQDRREDEFWIQLKHGPCRLTSRQIEARAQRLARIRTGDDSPAAEMVEDARTHILYFVGRIDEAA